MNEINSIFNKAFFLIVILGKVSPWIRPNVDEKRFCFAESLGKLSC